MSTRTIPFVQRPWQGGLNIALDAALISPDELTRADNCIFSTSGARKSRGGLYLWDYIATSVSRSSSSTTRTLVLTVNAGFTMAVDDVISVRTSSGLNTSYDLEKASITAVDTVTYSPNVAITYTASSSLTEALTADSDIRVGRYEFSDRMIGFYDYWYFESNNKLQKIIGVSSEGNFYNYSTTGSKSIISTSSLTLSGLTSVSFAVIANKLVMAFNGASNFPVYWDGTNPIAHISNIDWNGSDIQSTNPVPSLESLRLFNGRIYATVSDDPDRIHYSDIDTYNRWNGEGDSGAIEVAVGDGDSSGFKTIFPPFKGRLGVAKGNKLLQIIGQAPLQAVEEISDGIGSESHGAAIAVDQDDIVFISRNGIHSFSATDQFGDFSGAYLSDKIQPEFNELNLSNLVNFKGVYLPNINSIAFAVEEQGYTSNNMIYLYNIRGKQWYKWFQRNAEFQIDSMATFQNSNVKELLLGLINGRVLKYDADAEYDLVASSISFRVDTGIIYPDNDPNRIKGFKELGILYKTARDSIDFTVSAMVDNFDAQTINIVQEPDGDILGESFILGSSVLGFEEVLLPSNHSIDGYGFGIKISITSESPIELYGYSLLYEPAGDQQAVER